MVQRDLNTVVKSFFLVFLTALIFSYSIPAAQAVTIILIGRGLYAIAFGSFILSSDISPTKRQPVRLLPQTQLVLWAVGILGVGLATNGLRWFEPTVGYWVGMAVMLTLIVRKGFIWLWQQAISKIRGKNQSES